MPLRLAELKRQYLELSDRAALAEEALSKAPVQNK